MDDNNVLMCSTCDIALSESPSNFDSGNYVQALETNEWKRQHSKRMSILTERVNKGELCLGDKKHHGWSKRGQWH